MKSLINLSFKIAKNENSPALLTYIVAGDSTIKTSEKILNSLSKTSIFANLDFLIILLLLMVVTYRQVHIEQLKME